MKLNKTFLTLAVLMTILISGIVYSTVISNTAISDVTTVTATGAIAGATLDTGQGANELYDMDQNVLTTSNVAFQNTTITGGLDVTQAVGSGDYGLMVRQNDAKEGITIDQDGDENAIWIDSSATTSTKYAIQVNVGLGARGFTSQQTGNYSNVYAQKYGTGAGDNTYFSNEGTGTDMTLDQNGNGISLNIDTEATTADAINIDLNTNITAIDINKVGDGTGAGIPLDIENDGTGNGIFINQDGNGTALNIDSESTGYPAIAITTSSGGCTTGYYGLYTNSTGHLLYCLSGVAKVVTLT